MRLFFIVISIILSYQQSQAAKGFVEECLGIQPRKITCRSDKADFTVTKAKGFVVSNKKTSVSLTIAKIELLPGRITSTGMMDESVRFVGVNPNMIASMDIPCGQTDYGYVGLSNNTNEIPFESVAQCKIE